MNAETGTRGEKFARLVAIGASNLTRGLHSLVAVARDKWGPNIEILAALGHGRSFGMPSRVLVRSLPGILDSGLWRQLEVITPAPTLGLITDVGNDILYGASVPQTLNWVAECARRLQRVAQEIALTDLPLSSVQRLTPAEFLLFRTIWFPRTRLSLEQVIVAAKQLSAGLAALATEQNLRLSCLKAEWYGFDPIHIRFSQMGRAWREILCGESCRVETGKSTLLEAVRVYLLPPERRYILGHKRFTPQRGVLLGRGGRLWLY